jgi:osmotically-inducible protein OsmY
MRSLAAAAALACAVMLYGCAAAVIGGAAAGGYLVGEDRRTAAVMTDDEGIELKLNNRISEKYPDSHVNVTSYNRLVLLTGEAPNADARADIEKIAREFTNVRGTFNELAVRAPTPLSARANDSYITSKVKARFLDNRAFNPVHVKVVTEDAVVYQMGIV